MMAGMGGFFAGISTPIKCRMAKNNHKVSLPPFYGCTHNSPIPILKIQDILGVFSTKNNMGSLTSLFLESQGHGYHASIIEANIERVVPDRFQKLSEFAHFILSARSSARR